MLRSLCWSLSLTLLLTVALRADDAPPPKDKGKQKPLAIHYERYGGFAGFHDNLRIFADYTFQLDTPPQVPHLFRGKLGPEHRQQLAAHLKRYGKFEWKQESGPRVVDGMKERLQVAGSGQLTEENPKQLKTLLSQILLAARKGEKIPKAK